MRRLFEGGDYNVSALKCDGLPIDTVYDSVVMKISVLSVPKWGSLRSKRFASINTGIG